MDCAELTAAMLWDMRWIWYYSKRQKKVGLKEACVV